MSKVVCMGESLVDNMPSKDGFVMQAGGAPLNVACAVSKLGGEGCFFGKIGGDSASDFLLESIQNSGIDTRFLVRDTSLSTAMAYISLDENGDRKFAFSRTDTADIMLCDCDVDCNMLCSGDILHFGSSCLMGKSEFAHKKAVILAKITGASVSFDVNIRESLWDSLSDCVCKIKEFLPYADIVKVSEEELYQITLENDEKLAVKALFSYAPQCKILLVTKGANGACAYDRDMNYAYAPAVKTKVVNTTGAGDCFIGAVLYLLSQNKADLSVKSMQNAINFASKACSIQISREGSMSAMPTLAEVENVRGNK